MGWTLSLRMTWRAPPGTFAWRLACREEARLPSERMDRYEGALDRIARHCPGMVLGMNMRYGHVAGHQAACHHYGAGWEGALPPWEAPKAG